MRIVWDEATGHAGKADLVRPARGDSTVYEAWGVVTADNGRTYRIAAYRNRHAVRSTGRNRFAMASDDVAIYVPAGRIGSRILPESHLPDVRAFVLSAFKALYRAALAVDFDKRAAGYPVTGAPVPPQPEPLPADVETLPAETVTESPVAIGSVRVVDVTPTWRAILPMLRAAIEDGTAEGRRIAWGELERMAEAADKWNASVPA